MLKGSLLHQALSSHDAVEAEAHARAIESEWAWKEVAPYPTDAELEAEYQRHLLTSPECGDAD